MIVYDFIKRVREFGVFSIADIDVLYPNIDKRRLFEWQKKGYIVKLRNQWYALPEFFSEPFNSWIIANLVHQPSYVSLESALKFYRVIPEGVFSTTSVTTKRPIHIDIEGHSYSYAHMKSALFCGYHLIEADKYQRKIRIADFEKSIVDFFYFRSYYKSIKSISELRFNEPVLRDNLNMDHLFFYLNVYKNKELEIRIRKMLKIYTDA